MHPDWVSPWWQAACLPDRWDVCGISVPSLSVWHTFALENLRNAYLCGGSADRDAAAGVLIIAQRNRAEGRKLILSATVRTRALRDIYRALRSVAMPDLHAACSEYVDTCTRGVSRWVKGKGGGHRASVPFQWHLVARVGERAWDMPYAEARCLCDAMAEQAGDDSIMSELAQEMEDNWPEYEKAAS